MTTKTYPELKTENQRLRERLREAISAVDHGNMPAWVLTDHYEASKRLLKMADDMLDANWRDMEPDDFTDLRYRRNQLAKELGIDDGTG